MTLGVSAGACRLSRLIMVGACRLSRLILVGAPLGGKVLLLGNGGGPANFIEAYCGRRPRLPVRRAGLTLVTSGPGMEAPPFPTAKTQTPVSDSENPNPPFRQRKPNPPFRQRKPKPPFPARKPRARVFAGRGGGEVGGADGGRGL